MVAPAAGNRSMVGAAEILIEMTELTLIVSSHHALIDIDHLGIGFLDPL